MRASAPRRVAPFLVVILPLAWLASCSTFHDASDAAPPDGGGDAAPTDAVAPEDGGPDTPEDGVPDAISPSGFCMDAATSGTPPTFCADFDTVGSLGAWMSSGTPTVSTAQFESPPSELLAGPSGGPVSISKANRVSFAANQLKLQFAMYVAMYPSAANVRVMTLDLSPVQLQFESQTGGVQWGLAGGTTVLSVNLMPGWNDIVITVDHANATSYGTFSISVNGAHALSGPLAAVPSFAESMLTFGNGGDSRASIGFDNVALYITP